MSDELENREPVAARVVEVNLNMNDTAWHNPVVLKELTPVTSIEQYEATMESIMEQAARRAMPSLNPNQPLNIRVSQVQDTITLDVTPATRVEEQDEDEEPQLPGVSRTRASMEQLLTMMGHNMNATFDWSAVRPQGSYLSGFQPMGQLLEEEELQTPFERDWQNLITHMDNPNAVQPKQTP